MFTERRDSGIVRPHRPQHPDPACVGVGFVGEVLAMALVDHPLHPFVSPRSVAIIGVSPNWSYINTVLQQIIALGAPTAVYPVNPLYPEVP